MKKFFIFVHIEKAAGTTIHNLLKYNLPTYVSLRSWHPWTNEKEAEFTERDLFLLRKIYPFLKGIGGHSTRQSLNYEEVLPKDQKISYFTFVRDPISRYMSHFKYQVHVKKNNYTIDSYCKEPRFNNYMVKRIAGSENLEVAIENLKYFKFIGLKERFNQSLILMNKFIFDEELDLRYESKNINKKESEISFYSLEDYQKENIKNNNCLDLLLYKHIYEEVYPKYISEYGTGKELEFEERKLAELLKGFKYNTLKFNLIKLWKAYNVYFAEPLIRKYL